MIFSRAALAMCAAGLTALTLLTLPADPPAPAPPATHPCATATTPCSGTVTVPLDRTRAAGPTVEIGFDLVPHTGAGPRRGTAALLNGGPGGGNTAEEWTVITADLAATHDVLVVDHRGTGRSGRLFCPGLAEPGQGPVDPAAITACAEQLGDDAQLYGAVAMADDVEAVRVALGRGRLDVVGVSFGTVVGQTLAVRHPGAVRRLVLDSAVPLDRRLVDEDVALEAANAALIRTGCRPDGCPGVRGPVREWSRLVGSTRAAGGDLGELLWLQGTLPGLGRADELATAAAAAHRGDRDRLETLLREFPAPDLSALPSEPLPAEAPVSIALGLATTCSDRPGPSSSAAPVEQRQAEVDRTVDELPPDAFAPFTVAEYREARGPFAFGWAQLCVPWTAPTDRADLALPADGPYPPVPTLVVNGGLDAGTPPAEGAAVARRFPRSAHVVLPGEGHVPSTQVACAGGMVSRFLVTGAVDRTACRPR